MTGNEGWKITKVEMQAGIEKRHGRYHPAKFVPVRILDRDKHGGKQSISIPTKNNGASLTSAPFTWSSLTTCLGEVILGPLGEFRVEDPWGMRAGNPRFPGIGGEYGSGCCDGELPR